VTPPNTFPTPKAAVSKADTAAFVLILLFTLFRIWYASRLGLAQDEAHYWQWSRHPALSYYDQGPGIAACIRLGTTLLGQTTLGVRIITLLLSAGTSWLAYMTATRWADRRVGLWTILLLNTAPLFAAGSLLATYDNPQVFFWTAALYALTWTVQEERPAGWYLVGVLVGLGSLCKLTMLLFAPCTLIFLLVAPSYRRWLRTPHPYLSFLIALLFFAPVVYWNAGHDWVNLRHTMALTTGRTRNAAPLRWFGDFLGGQAGLLGPFVFLAELYVLVRLAKPWPGLSDTARRFLGSFGAPIFVLCLAMSLRSKLESNWPAPTHIAALMAVAVWLCSSDWRSEARRQTTRILLLATGALLSVLIFFPEILPAVGIHPNSNLAQKLNEPYGWPEIASRVQEERDAVSKQGKPVFVAGTNYRVNSILAFYLDAQPETVALYLGTRRDAYWFWTDSAAHVGENAVLVTSESAPEVAALAGQVFDRIEEAPPASVTRPGFSGVAKEWHIYRCYRFHGYDPQRYVSGY